MAGLWKALFARSALRAGQDGGGEIADPAQLDWRKAETLPLFYGLDAAERTALHALAMQLLADKTLTPVAGARLDGMACAAIALQAALPILRLGYSAYQGWREIVLYPGEFVPDREVIDDFGIVHRVRQPLSGEAWEGGPVVLSLEDVAASGHCEGYNVVIHEFAHKLDMRNGAVDGLPVLHSGMSVETWAGEFSAAYADFCRRVDAEENTSIDPYASESPAEFFAVLSEYFFEAPDILIESYPSIYDQMRQYYRQDPLSRLMPLLQGMETR